MGGKVREWFGGGLVQNRIGLGQIVLFFQVGEGLVGGLGRGWGTVRAFGRALVRFWCYMGYSLGVVGCAWVA